MTPKRYIVPLLAALFGIGACEAGEAPAADATPTTQDSAAGIAPTPGTLTPINQSGVRGEVRLTGGGDELAVAIDAEGLQPGMLYEAYLHEGSCAQGGPVAASLGSVTPDEAGNGTLEASEAGQNAEDVSREAGIFVQIHDADDQPISCANLTMDDQRS